MRFKHKIFFTVFFTIFAFVKGQNLVPNPSFEDTVHCPTNANQLSNCQLWTNPTHATPDYFNACSIANSNTVHVPNNAFGTQIANTGVAYSGFYAYNKPFHGVREYIQTSFSLLQNHKYLVSFYLSLADISQYAISTIGAYFSSSPIVSTTTLTLNYIPQIQNKSSNILSDKTNWMLVSDTLFADGGEQYMTIGNFKPDSLSDTLYLGFSSSNNVAYYYIDDVSIIDYGVYTGIKKNENNLQVNVYPNPAKNVINIETKEAVETNLFDVLGSEVLTTKEKTINIESLPNGIYFIKVTSSVGHSFQQKIIVNH